MKHKISWTNATWNICTGCTPIASGCQNCYARKMHDRLRRMGQPKYQHPFSVVVCHPEELNRPSYWKKPRMVFVNSMSDTFHPSISFGFLNKLFNKMRRYHQHTYQILTKRPENILEFYKWYARSMLEDEWFKHIWLGFSASTPPELEAGAKYLRDTPAAVRFFSLEPLLADFPNIDLTGISWVIVGAESKGAHPGRPCELSWVRNIVEQCQAAGVACFVKQIHMNGKLIKDVNRFPPDLQIQQMPEVK